MNHEAKINNLNAYSGFHGVSKGISVQKSSQMRLISAFKALNIFKKLNKLEGNI